MQDYSLKRRKMRALLIISVLLLLIYAKNLIERRSFRDISSTFTEVYNDRLLVEGYIFQISEGLFQIQKLIDHCNLDYDYSKVIDEIESNIVNDLSIKSYDLLYTDSAGVNRNQVKLYDQKISQARRDLDNLSKIQMVEGEKLISKAKVMINRSQIWAQFEVALLIILIVVLFLLVFRKSEETKGMI